MQSGALHCIHEIPQNSHISKLQLMQSVAWIADGLAQKRHRRDTVSVANFEVTSIKLIWPSPIKQIFSPNCCHFVSGCALSSIVFISTSLLLLLLLSVDFGFAFWNSILMVLSMKLNNFLTTNFNIESILCAITMDFFHFRLIVCIYGVLVDELLRL